MTVFKSMGLPFENVFNRWGDCDWENDDDDYDDYKDKNNADDDNDDDDEGKENCIFHPSRRPDISNGFKSNHRNTNSNIKPQNSHFQNSKP